MLFVDRCGASICRGFQKSAGFCGGFGRAADVRFGSGMGLGYDFSKELLMAHEKPKWYDRYWYWFVIAFGIACMLGLDFWHPILGG